MKLQREDLEKTMNTDGSMLYKYTCKGNDFYIKIVGFGDDRTVFVYKNDEFDTNLQNVFSTKDNFLAWEEFERLVNECSDKPQSSGGFKKDPQANPFTLPLLAINFNGNVWDVVFFIQAEEGGQSVQVSLVQFTLEANQFSFKPNSDDLFKVNWSSYEVPDIFKSEIVMKKFDTVVFEENPSASVFLFLPKNITSQGGNPQPQQKDDDGGDDGGDGQPDPNKKKKKSDKKGKPSDDDGGDSGDGGDGGDGGDSGDGGDGGDSGDGGDGGDGNGDGDGDDDGDGDGDRDDEDKKPKPRPDNRPRPMPTDTLQALSESIGIGRNIIEPFFVTTKRGELFLLSNNFEKIKIDLQLPSSTTAKELSESIINQIQ